VPLNEGRRERPIGGWLGRHRAQFRLGLRITVASLATFALARLLGFAQSSWAVLTALIVMQASVGGSLKATADRLVGSLGGAAWGVAVCLAVPRADAVGLGVALAVGVAPLAVAAAIRPAYRVAPVTAIILLLGPPGHPADALGSAVQRMAEIGLGSLVALAVALLVLPERAHRHLAKAAGAALVRLAELTARLADAVTGPYDGPAIQALHDAIRAAIGAAESAAAEAGRERRSYLAAGPDPEPLCRTLRRLRNGLSMIGHALAEPLPGPARERLDGPAKNALAVAAELMGAAGKALAGRLAPPSPLELEEAVAAFESAVNGLRRSGLTRALADDALGRVFGLAFALAELRGNLADLIDRAAEMA
jgi:uncharacterized membrane protein YccC